MVEHSLKAPSPGSWTLDAEHCDRAHSRYLNELPDLYTRGFRESMARYGLLLDTLECAYVDGFTYICPRPLGAPKGATKLPPRFIFKAMLLLHPELRRRVRRAEEVLATKPWRQDAVAFSATVPQMEAELLAMQREPIETHDRDALIEHLRRAGAFLRKEFYDHFRFSCASLVPVGDLIAHVVEWTGAAPEEIVKVLSGSSPHSLDGCTGLSRLVRAIESSTEAQRTLESADALERLERMEGEVGDAFQRWYERVSQRILTGHDVAELRALETPESLLALLRSRVADQARPSSTVEITAALRQRIPAQHHGTFDELLAEARSAHPLRDARSIFPYWVLGLNRRALLEAGRRLEADGRLFAPDHAVDLTEAEVIALLRGQPGPSREEVRGWVESRRARSVEQMPRLLGNPPGSPPPYEWLPPAVARVQRAVDTYIPLMFGGEPGASKGPDVVEGLAASPGVHRGRARLVLSPDAFDRIERGDVLIARITNPSYNVLLPILGAIVTDRGGLLSHPAIVAREYGLPAVVGAGDATRRIPDGAEVEVDGNSGRVRVMSP